MRHAARKIFSKRIRKTPCLLDSSEYLIFRDVKYKNLSGFFLLTVQFFQMTSNQELKKGIKLCNVRKSQKGPFLKNSNQITNHKGFNLM